MLPDESSNQSFKVNDIVLLLPSPAVKSSPNWPAIGSQHEIDCKILHISPHTTADGKKAKLYQLISGHGVNIQTLGNNLIYPRDRHFFESSEKVETIMATELCPGQTVFVLRKGAAGNDYFSNDEFEIHISRARMDALIKENIFRWI